MPLLISKKGLNICIIEKGNQTFFNFNFIFVIVCTFFTAEGIDNKTET